MAIADSGTTGHFLQMSSKCVNKQQKNEGLRVKLPDKSVIKSTHKVLLNIPQLPMAARRAHLFQEITHVLLSICMLCDQRYMEIFDDKRVYIIKEGKVLLHGNRDPETNLYMVNITSYENNTKSQLDIKHLEILGAIANCSNNAYEIKAKKQLMTYYHRCCFSPVISTWIKAIEQGNFCTWPGLTVTSVEKYLDKSMTTSKGHMQQ